MPRTKRPVKKAKKSVEATGNTEELLKKLAKFTEDEKKKIDMCAHMQIRNIEMQCKIFVGSLSKKYLTTTVGQAKSELYLEEVPSARMSRNTVRSASHDDGYNTENSSQGSGGRGAKKCMGPPSSASRSTARRSRSADTSARKPAPRRTTQRRLSRSVYRTPMQHKIPHEFPPITPKVAPQTPLTVLRQPRQGEMVVSMQGSPVMVPSFISQQQDEAASCHIQLNDGTMLSVRPRELRQSSAYIPMSLMAPSVLDQIQTLKDNLDKVIQWSHK